MLKGVPAVIGPELLSILSRMGHGDVLAVVDTNYPAYGKGPEVARLDGIDLPEALDAILTLFPLDTFVEPVHRMGVVGDPAAVPEAVVVATDVIRRHDGRQLTPIAITRDEFYAAASAAFGTVVTGEARAYGCLLLTKGVIFAPDPQEDPR